ncbi:signal transduction histidine kinase [Sinorhizobium meliloti]
MARSLNVQIIRTMCVVAIVDFITMVLAAVLLIFMAEWLQEWLQAELNDMYEWFYLIISISVGLIPGVVVGWRLAHKIMRPLKSVATAVRSIASGDFSARAKATQSSFSEAEALIVDFNAMAARLERAEEELKYSSSATAHELRTPLTVLLASLQGLSDGVVEPSSELYELLICQVTDLTGMVEDLRTFDLANAGTLEIDLQEVDLTVEAEVVISSMEQKLVSAGITIEREFGPRSCARRFEKNAASAARATRQCLPLRTRQYRRRPNVHGRESGWDALFGHRSWYAIGRAGKSVRPFLARRRLASTH